MTVTLRPETGTILRERAGQDTDTFTNTLLTDVLADDPVDLTEEERKKK